MKKYKIKIEYKTGNSMSAYDDAKYIELSWDNINIAKENLEFIKQHNDMIYAISLSENRNRYVPDGVDKYEWFVNENINESNFNAVNFIKLKNADGELVEIPVFWHGEYQKIYSAEIIEMLKKERICKKT